MDFSTPSRSLRSLSRRNPPLPAEAVDVGGRILKLHDRLFAGAEDEAAASAATRQEEQEAGPYEEYGRLILMLVEMGRGAGDGGTGTGSGSTKRRWEPLAIGLHLANDYLERLGRSVLVSSAAAAAAATDATTYFDGPRVPTLTAVGPGSTGVTHASSTGARAGAATGASGDDASASAALIPKSILVALFPNSNGGGDDNDSSYSLPTAFCRPLLSVARDNLEHSEPRVRGLVARVVGSHARLATLLPAFVASSSSPSETTAGICVAGSAVATLTAQRRSLHAHIQRSLQAQLAAGRDEAGPELSRDSTGALDDTTGWRSVETSLQAVAAYVNGCGGAYVTDGDDLLPSGTAQDGHTTDAVDDEAKGGAADLATENDGTLLAALRYCSISHVNRHVRAAGVQVLEQLIHSVVAAGGGSMEMLTDPQAALRVIIVDVLKTTLADNWSQVRMAGSVLNRAFWLALLQNPLPPGVDLEETTAALYPVLLPRMCLNRFYLAQGVKLYSHETWRLVFGRTAGEGLRRVAENAGVICRYYIKMADADNHAVREASCQAIAELAHKIGSHPTCAEYLAPYVPMLLQGLLMCFHDESWPVRDEACLACGTFVRAYPEECRPDLKTLFERWTEQLTDQIWSVRENAAVALGDAIVAYGQPMFDEVLRVVQTNLPTAREQPAMTREEYKRLQNDIDAHTNSQLYSCGSLAPKLGKGRKDGAGRIGCCNGALTRERMPWEATDGCIYLIRELCVRCTGSGEAAAQGVVLSDEVLLPLLTELEDVCRCKHFPQSDDMRATLWRQLPIMANALGKNRFKRQYLHIFLDLLAANLDADRSGSGASQLSVHAAGQCAEELARLVGFGIFRGRLEAEGEWQVEAFDRAMEDRKRQAHMGPPVEQGFSPFGPANLIPQHLQAPPPIPATVGAMKSAAAAPAPQAPPRPDGGFERELSL